MISSLCPVSRPNWHNVNKHHDAIIRNTKVFFFFWEEHLHYYTYHILSNVLFIKCYPGYSTLVYMYMYVQYLLYVCTVCCYYCSSYCFTWLACETVLCFEFFFIGSKKIKTVMNGSEVIINRSQTVWNNNVSFF